MTDSPRTVAHYVLHERLASGGMGDVYLASPRETPDARVALKLLRAELAEDPVFRALFADELRLTSRLDHPNIARALDHGEHEGALFAVFEYVEGASLEQIGARADRSGVPVPIGVALRIMADVCRALHAAHTLRSDSGSPLHVVHRDVSPSNVVVRVDGIAKLIDFGIAKARERLAAETRAGFVRGNPLYRSPEQAAGRAVDARADVWGVGATLLRVLTGAPPFASAEEMDAFVFGLRELPRLSGAVSEPLATVVRRALARSPAHRFQTAEALERALDDAGETLRAHASASDVAAFLASLPAERGDALVEDTSATIPEAPVRATSSGEVTRDVRRP